MLSIWITSHSSWVVNEVFLYFLVWKDQLASGINTMVWGQYKLSIILDQIPLYFLTKLETLKPHLDLLIFGLYSLQLLTFCKIGSSTHLPLQFWYGLHITEQNCYFVIWRWEVRYVGVVAWPSILVIPITILHNTPSNYNCSLSAKAKQRIFINPAHSIHLINFLKNQPHQKEYKWFTRQAWHMWVLMRNQAPHNTPMK